MIVDVESEEQMVPWPSEQLENLELCPLCSGANSRVLYSDLVDWMSAPPTGLWRMNACSDCGIAFLSPRPVSESIAAAYSHYYTHSSEKDDLVHNRFRSIKDYFSESYYSAASKKSSFLDYVIYLLVRIFFPVSLYFDAKSRHIFKENRNPGKLLDIGCGNGEFLKFADKAGWQVVGVDFDEGAVTEAKSGGFDVRLGGVEVIGSEERFDFISLSHVIEHVYNPEELIYTCYSLLNEGGALWLETPNIDSVGYALYKSNWRGLEPPRHIMIFNIKSLTDILLKSGFTSVKQKNHGLSGVYMGLASERLLAKSRPCGSVLSCTMGKMIILVRILAMELIQLSSKKRREFLTLVATR